MIHLYNGIPYNHWGWLCRHMWFKKAKYNLQMFGYNQLFYSKNIWYKKYAYMYISVVRAYLYPCIIFNI